MSTAKRYAIKFTHPDGTSSTHQMSAQDMLDCSDDHLAHASENLRRMRNANWSAALMMVFAALEVVIFVACGYSWAAVAALFIATLGLLDRASATRHFEEASNSTWIAESLTRTVQQIHDRDKEQAA